MRNINFIHILGSRNEEIKAKKIIAVKDALTQFMQFRKESMKNSGLSGFEHRPLRYTGAAL